MLQVIFFRDNKMQQFSNFIHYNVVGSRVNDRIYMWLHVFREVCRTHFFLLYGHLLTVSWLKTDKCF